MIVADRQSALVSLGYMKDNAPYGEKKGFPENIDFITEATGIWLERLHQLRIALNYKILDNSSTNAQAY